MTTARLTARWSGVLVNSLGRSVLLRSRTGSVVTPAPSTGTPGTTTAVVYTDNTPVLYADSTPVEYNS